MKTLIVCPHTDDESISCGGLIQARVAAGVDVRVVVPYGSRTYNYKNSTAAEMQAELDDFDHAREILGYDLSTVTARQEGEPEKHGYYDVLHEIEKELSSWRPDEVVCPGGWHLNQDHVFLARVTGIALRPSNLGAVVRVLEFFPLDGTFAQPSYYVPLTTAQVGRKLEAIRAYRREARGGTSPRAPDNVVAQMRVWGAACGTEFAEGYRLRFAREAGADHHAGGGDG